MKSSLLFVFLALFFFPVHAGAIPAYLAHQGRIFDSGEVPVSGSVDLQFSLYEQSEGGDSIWTEDHTLTCDNGFYTVVLGDLLVLDDSIITGTDLFLGVQLNGAEMSPRPQITSFPYAFLAGSVHGRVVATEGLVVNGVQLIDEDGLWLGDSLESVGPQGSEGAVGTELWVDGDGVVTTTAGVGIGTEQPDAELDVNGNIIATVPASDNHVATKSYVDASSDSCNLIGENSADNGVDTTLVQSNPGGSALERMDALQNDLDRLSTGQVVGPYSETCTDYSDLGYPNRLSCMQDGRWHKVGDFTADTPLGGDDFTLISALVGGGADFKVQYTGSSRAIIPVQQIIPNCYSVNDICFYIRRENGTGWATLVWYVSTSGGDTNGSYSVGNERDLHTEPFYRFFAGTSADIDTGTMDYSLMARQNWRLLGTFGGGVPLDSQIFNEIRDLSYSGAKFKVSPASGTDFRGIVKVNRVIPNCGDNCVWMYMLREDDGHGEITFGLALTTDSDNGNYWIGDPRNITNLSDYFTGTSSDIDNGTFQYNLFVSE